MHENFIALDQEKRDRIINAAMREFSAKGYKNASTNEIIKKAGISKGALFHYFAAKRDLFAFLCHYSVDFFTKTADPRLQELPSDVFARWIAFSALKMEIGAQYPDMADFMRAAYAEDAPETQGLVKEALARVSDGLLQKIAMDIDYSKFKREVDAQKALQIIWWVLEGYAHSKQKEPLSDANVRNSAWVASVMREVEAYLAILRKAFYKEEHLR